MQEKAGFTSQNMAVLIKVVNTFSIESARAANDAMHLIAFAEQKLR